MHKKRTELTLAYNYAENRTTKKNTFKTEDKPRIHKYSRKELQFRSLFDTGIKS
jgi:hypothetical protein